MKHGLNIRTRILAELGKAREERPYIIGRSHANYRPPSAR